MDIDFHYFATYVASRFAGYSKDQSKIISSSAQMIDENARHTLLGKPGDTTGVRGVPDDFEIRMNASGSVLHKYRVQQTFQMLGDIGTSYTGLSSIWPVYHFLPGNFKLQGRGQEQFTSPRWRQRTYTAANPNSETLKKFEHLCRPHSPMAIALINNCRALVNDPYSTITKHQLECYFIGVTMHVFIDTWAHQDFVGIASRSINDIHNKGVLPGWQELTYGYVGKNDSMLPKLNGDEEPYVDSLVGQWRQAPKWGKRSPGIAAHEFGAVYTGHGRAGHLPDHSSLIWKYHPYWSATEITRYNPVVYWDAFIHMVKALSSIRNDSSYKPTDLDDKNNWLSSPEPCFNAKNLKIVYDLIKMERDPVGGGVAAPPELEDQFDRGIYQHGIEWIEGINKIFPNDEFTVKDDHWLPGESLWVINARSQLAANKKLKNTNWYTVEQFKSLDFFKFNVATKFHYRFVKQQLLAFNQKLIGDWEDGAAYDDLDWLDETNNPLDLVRKDILKKLSDLQRKENKREVNEGITLLIRDIVAAPSIQHIQGILQRLVSGVNSASKLTDKEKKSFWSYGILNEKGVIQSQTAFKSIKELLGSLPVAETIEAPPNLAIQVKIALDDYSQQSKGIFTRQSDDSKKAVKFLSEILSGNADANLNETVLFLVGRSSDKPLILSKNGINPLKEGSRFYNLLLQAYRYST
jgi:hypothetical protein